MPDKLLIADDEPDIVDTLARCFAARGYEILRAHSGEEAVRQAGRAPDLILLDVNMPGLDGLEVCRRIRQHVACPIIFLTARVEEADKLRGFAAGGDDYVVKPFSLEELAARAGAPLRRGGHRGPPHAEIPQPGHRNRQDQYCRNQGLFVPSEASAHPAKSRFHLTHQSRFPLMDHSNFPHSGKSRIYFSRRL